MVSCMKYIVSGMLDLPKGRRAFKREVEASSEQHAKELTYAFFGSKNGLKRTKVKIEQVKPAGKEEVKQ